jgi:hypothetical protein
MVVPGFNADASLYQSDQHYRMAMIDGTLGSQTVSLQTTPQKCSIDWFEICMSDAQHEYGKCSQNCIGACTPGELTAPKSSGCRACLTREGCVSGFYAHRDVCIAIAGCPKGTSCMGDAYFGDGNCCPTGTIACGSQCISNCSPPSFLDPKKCQCICPWPWTNCGGICRNLQMDSINCGSCGNVCNYGEGCCNGVCTNLNTMSNCGSCGNNCNPGEGCCNGVCTNLNTMSNCGSCGNDCNSIKYYPTGSICRNGQCECPTGQTPCDISSKLKHGVCTDLNTDPNHCGSCRYTCNQAVATCQNGACVCLPGGTDCGSNSCCPPNLPICCGNGTFCCPSGTTCCGSNSCCSLGTTCCGNGCCPPNFPICCGNFCCPSGTTCTQSGCI